MATGIEVAEKVMKEGVQVFRLRKGTTDQYDAKSFFDGNKRGWVALDAFSASAILAVYKALNEENKAKFAALPLVTMAKVAFKLVK